jgi:hypothetical protein
MSLDESVVQQLIRSWGQSGVAVRGAASKEALHAAEARLGVSLGQDLRSFYGLVDGAADAGSADSFFERHPLRIWPIGELTRDPGAAEPVVVFADFLLGSREYGLRLATSEVVAIGEADGGTSPVAPDLRTFLQLLLEGSPKLFG